MRAGLAVAVAVGADLVDVEIVVGVLDRRNAVAAAGEFLDEAHGKAGLAGILPAGDAEDFRYPFFCAHLSCTKHLQPAFGLDEIIGRVDVEERIEKARARRAQRKGDFRNVMP